MPRIKYIDKKFKPETMAVIVAALTIIREYEQAGIDLTLRQLYYQFVSRDLFANSERNYKKLGDIVSDARLAGLIDWNMIQDRTRYVRQNAHWDNPLDAVKAWANGYTINLWEGQRIRPEVWIEKDALVGLMYSVCTDLDVPYFSCRGYTSQSEMWGASQRLLTYANDGQLPVIFHLGDHDPSGIDMTRDIQDRLRTFFEPERRWTDSPEVIRVALTMDQVEQYNPPPNPAKVTDSRFEDYARLYGTKSWELDALRPEVIIDLVRTHIFSVMDETILKKNMERQQLGRKEIANLATKKSRKPRKRTKSVKKNPKKS